MMIALRKKIAQMLVIGFSGCELHADSPVIQWIQEDGLGGVLLFDYDLQTNTPHKNIQDSEQLKALIATLQGAAKEASVSADQLPLLVGIDYEGGAVDRLMHVKGMLPTLEAKQQVELTDEALFSEATRMASILKNLGFNLNFAPVVDLSLDEQNGIIGRRGRAFSADPQAVIRAAKLFVRAHWAQGIVCSYKHFPGHGSATGDTHLGFVDVTKTFNPQELLPYQALLQDTSLETMVMTAHVVNRVLDPSGCPATLSGPILTGLLRQTIGFDGVIVSDDLQMHAISHHYTMNDALQLTINAGADMLIMGNQWGDTSATAVIDAIMQLVDMGRIDRLRIEEAYNRIIRLKQSLK